MSNLDGEVLCQITQGIVCTDTKLPYLVCYFDYSSSFWILKKLSDCACTALGAITTIEYQNEI